MAKLQTVKQSLDIRLGSDLKFPIDNNFDPISGMNLLIQDIQQLLLTMPGERVFRPEFGCHLRDQIWENLDTAVIDGAQNIREALEKFEPRITVDEVDGTVNENTQLIIFNIRFTVNSTDSAVNLIFPFRSGLALSGA